MGDNLGHTFKSSTFLLPHVCNLRRYRHTWFPLAVGSILVPIGSLSIPLSIMMYIRSIDCFTDRTPTESVTERCDTYAVL
ncbi:hypothetical protein ARMGADRAFT_1011387 [Armillaria gallica]|uniref:Uncharacterized protein n=1 Tax=Armillaria gallica TaxID=47427 RepID=A0A2H3DNV3_ARMGA|nr:hypothetical protein ARMGADRAFT_1011387 [Armillaria gallica]